MPGCSTSFTYPSVPDKDTIPADAEVQRASATCDNFIDIPNLIMEPRWAQWAPYGFAPVGGES